MVHIYYHIYAVDGVESVIDEQLSLIEKHFDFPYILNVGISIANENSPTDIIIEKFYKYSKPNYRIRDVRYKGNEFTTIELINKDKENFGDSDYILYIHTKGASKQNNSLYNNIVSWRHLMNYFNIEDVKNVFEVFDKTDFNSYGVLLTRVGNWIIYSGNFWWIKSDYVKSIKMDYIKRDRFSAETQYIQYGDNWKPYSPYNVKNVNHYSINFKREEYEK